MRVYRSAVLVAILLQATPGAYLWDASQTWDWPKSGDKVSSTEVSKRGIFFGQAKYTGSLHMNDKRINCVKFWDKDKSGATIWMSKEPPCYYSKITITSAPSIGFRFGLDIYYEG